MECRYYIMCKRLHYLILYMSSNLPTSKEDGKTGAPSADKANQMTDTSPTRRNTKMTGFMTDPFFGFIHRLSTTTETTILHTRRVAAEYHQIRRRLSDLTKGMKTTLFDKDDTPCHWHVERHPVVCLKRITSNPIHKLRRDE